MQPYGTIPLIASKQKVKSSVEVLERVQRVRVNRIDRTKQLVVGIDHVTNKMLVRLRYIMEEQDLSAPRISYSEVVRRAIKEMAARYNIE